MRWGGWKLGRQYVAVAAVFAVLSAISFASFGYLVVEQLSRSYLEDVLLSGKEQAEDLARQLKGPGNLYKVIETKRTALAQISSALSRQQVIDRVQVFDNEGKLVYSSEFRTEGLKGGFPESSGELLVPSSPERVVESSTSYQIRAPLEDIGTVVVSISKPAMAARIAILRRNLLIQTAVAGGTSLALLLGAVMFIWHLVQRNNQLEDKRRLNEELAALGSLAANLAHEIRNPLNALSINLELLQEDIENRQGPVDTVGMARREVGRLSRLVNDFLVYARPAPPLVEEFDGEGLLRDAAALLAPVCERFGVELRVAEGSVRVRGDRGQLGQVLTNLALNSVQAMDGCSVRRVELRAFREEEKAVLEVSDTGPGIPRHELAQVREAFFTRRKGGTGLGLAIADRIVTAHGGTLELANRKTGGLVAQVVLPAAKVE
ncbi:MAG: HAMP domain-containing histidine kinase [Acidobacteriia bacterium]|nr:HAMP domain-containing histidine kinase [Terriglobia bacterium]